MRGLICGSFLVSALIVILVVATFGRNHDVPDDDNDWVIKYRCVEGGKSYSSVIRKGDLRKSPAWNERDSLPVSPGRALELARKKLESTVPAAKEWELKLIGLQPTHFMNRWIYAVEFNPPIGPAGFRTGPPEWLSIAVLMDGRVLAVEVQDYKPGQ